MARHKYAGKIVEKFKVMGVAGKFDAELRLLDSARGWFGVVCPAFDIQVEGKDVAAIRAELGRKVVDASAIKWEKFYEVSFRETRMTGTGGGRESIRDGQGFNDVDRPDFEIEGEFCVEIIEIGVRSDGETVYRNFDTRSEKRSHIYTSDPRDRTDSRNGDGVTISIIPMTPETTAALLNLRTMFCKLHENLLKWMRQDVILKNLTSGALLALSGPANASTIPEVIRSADRSPTDRGKRRRRT